MRHPSSKLHSLEGAIGLIMDGDIVAIGGDCDVAQPMALVREIARQRKRDLHLICNRGIALDLLVGAGCVATVETVPAKDGSNNQAFDRAMTAGTIRVTEHSRAVALARLRAGASGAPFMVAGPDSAVSPTDPAVRSITDPFTGLPCLAVQAIRPDVAIIHAQTADISGVVQSAATSRLEEPPDVTTGRSARITIVSVEQIVSHEASAARPLDTILSPPAVTCVVEAPYGAHPCRCDGRYDADVDSLGDYQTASREPAALEAWLDRLVRGPADHWAYLDRIGSRRLLGVSRNRNRRV